MFNLFLNHAFYPSSDQMWISGREMDGPFPPRSGASRQISFHNNQFCIAQQLKPSLHVLWRQDVRGCSDKGDKAGRASEIWDWIRVMKWRHFPAAWLSYNIKATIIKCSNTVGLHFTRTQPWNCIFFFVLLLYWSLLQKKKKKKYGQKWLFITKMVRLQKITKNIINIQNVRLTQLE